MLRAAGRGNGRAHPGGRTKRGATLATTALLLALVPAACGGGSGANGDDATVRVFAASSLTEAFSDMATAFQRSGAGDEANVDVLFQFGASSTLAQQIDSGAPVDVFVSADEATMARAAPEATSTVIARNRLALIVEKGNPKSIDGLDDLAAPGVVFVLCVPAAPCGHLGAALLARAGIDAKPASLEENVKAVVSKVALGEADAGLVYQTDVVAAEATGTAQGIAIGATADDPELQAVYPMVVLSHTEGAKAWAAFVTSAAGRRALAEHGFLPPDT